MVDMAIVIAMTYQSTDSFPQHVAIIMDGNGRWAKQRGLPRLAGHQVGIINAHRIEEILFEYSVKYLTLYVFSTENWNRPRAEVEGIFRILAERIDEEVEFAQQKNIRICYLGKLVGLPPLIKEKSKRAVELTNRNTAMTLSLAFNYGSRDEIVQAVRQLSRDAIPAENIDENLFSQYLYTMGIPDPDFVIRTGGEMRLSNFLLWQVAYAEFYFTEALWPDFGRGELDKALMAYRERQRRFGAVIP